MLVNLPDPNMPCECPNDLNTISYSPLISVVTPSFNQAGFIEEALESVSSQSYCNSEHLIIDGMSTDGTQNILRKLDVAGKYHNVKWTSEPDDGQSSALNKGFRQARGSIIGWLNSDDRYRDGCFELVSKAFEDNPHIDVFYGDYSIMNEFGKILQIRREIEFSHFILLHHRVLYIPTTATFFRRKIFDEGNYLAEDLHYAMDVEFFVRLAAKGYRIKHLGEVLADYRIQPASKSCSSPFMQRMEHDRIILNVAPSLRWIRSMAIKRLALSLLRRIAAFKRYSEKLFRGYYWQQFCINSMKTKL